MTTFAITNAYVGTKTGGSVQPPQIGEWWPLTVEFTVSGTPKNPYQIAFSIAEQSAYGEFTDLTPGPKTATEWLFVPLDGTIPWTVEIDPFNLADAADPTKSNVPVKLPNGIGIGSTVVVKPNPSVTLVTGKKQLQGTFQPAPPASAIEFYDPLWAIGAQSAFTKFKPGGTISQVEALLGCPTSESWQKLLSSVCRADTGLGNEFLAARPVENPSEQPVYFWRKQNVPVQDISLIHQFAVELRNSRVNASILRAVTWDQLDALAGINVFKFYRSPETVVDRRTRRSRRSSSRHSVRITGRTSRRTMQRESCSRPSSRTLAITIPRRERPISGRRRPSASSMPGSATAAASASCSSRFTGISGFPRASPAARGSGRTQAIAGARCTSHRTAG